MSWRDVLTLDARLSDRMRIAEQPGTLRSIAIVLAHSGDSWFCLAGLALLWGFGNDFWKTRALAFSAALIITAVVVVLLKFTIRRKRPEGEWGGIYRNTDPHSFPSGHAARTALFAVLGLILGPTWFGLALLAWAPLVALARVAMGVHYLSDVLVGLAIGLVMGWVNLGLYWQYGEILIKLVMRG
jgi:undecaprenyl-diphosphatase